MDGRSVQFDMFVWQVVPWPALLDAARYLETQEVGTLWLGDAYAMPPAYNDPVLEVWTTLAALAARTTRLRLGTLISNVAFRHPAMLAKQAATVDCISEGRLDLGVGPGEDSPEAARALGLSPSTSRARLDRLEEAVVVLDRLLRDRRLSYHGAYYHLEDAPLVPAPVQQPRPPLVIAAEGTRALRVAAQYADVWVTIPAGRGTREDASQSVGERARLLDEHCGVVGRNPATIDRACVIGWGGPEVPFASTGALQDCVGRYREAGIRRFIFCFGGAATPTPYRELVTAKAWASPETLDAFAGQVMRDLSRLSSSR